MTLETIAGSVRRAAFRRIVWLAPAAYAVHIAEELPRFPQWASTHFAPGFTTLRFVVANALIMLALLALTTLVSTVRVRAVDFVYLSWVAGQLFCNALFHLGTTVWFGVYSPGLVSALLLYLPVSWAIAGAARREGRIGTATGLAALAVGAGAMFCLAYFGLGRAPAPG